MVPKNNPFRVSATEYRKITKIAIFSLIRKFEKISPKSFRCISNAPKRVLTDSQYRPISDSALRPYDTFRHYCQKPCYLPHQAKIIEKSWKITKQNFGHKIHPKNLSFPNFYKNRWFFEKVTKSPRVSVHLLKKILIFNFVNSAANQVWGLYR